MKMKWFGQYTLHEKLPVPCYDLEEWENFLKNPKQRIVGRTQIRRFMICTDFLGLDRAFFFQTRPQLFETMIFNTAQKTFFGAILCDTSKNFYQTRCSTWLEAEKMHENAIRYVKNLVKKRK